MLVNLNFCPFPSMGRGGYLPAAPWQTGGTAAPGLGLIGRLLPGRSRSSPEHPAEFQPPSPVPRRAPQGERLKSLSRYGPEGYGNHHRAWLPLGLPPATERRLQCKECTDLPLHHHCRLRLAH
ncbi:hypothetical protein AAFF_G00233370 [Aldrovandia affinis]|uniref:Uncharacterized protein n=1 Tax=Aldrovandia affinis TaxID=143900 RepID=A0AAD7RF66_9TELE|nr:hypothetical protein AAFF_G00233370 [Aldrovandia affinis]